jgi:hypothetical protein
MSVEKLIRQSIIEDNTLSWSQRRNRHKASIVRSHSAGGLKIFASLPPKSPRIWRPLELLARLDGIFFDNITHRQGESQKTRWISL